MIGYLKGQLIATYFRIVGARQLHQLRISCNFPRVYQSKTLRAILESAKDTVYGKEHHFEEILAANKDYELYDLFRKYNKPAEYEDFRPYVDRMLNGEADVLIKGKPVLYSTTSGSSGKPKYVPISQDYLKNIYKKMNKLWISVFVRKKGWRMFNGKIFAIVGKGLESYAPDGTVCGSVSAFAQRSVPKFVSNMYVIPNSVYEIEDYGVRNYVLMRLSMEHDIRVWLVPNPSSILEMQNTVDRWLDQIIDDIGNGTISDQFKLPEEIRKQLTAKLHPNPRRAQFLRMLQNKYERVLPRHFWPKLQILTSWKCGNTQVYLKKCADFFPADVFHQEMGYFATECRAGVAIDESLDSVLMAGMHFFEFKREKDFEDPDAPFYFIWELKEGERYCPFVTTMSGLYRYNLNDIIQAGPDFRNVNKVHMVQKVNGIVSITGEKLYEGQFIKAVEDAEQTTGMKLIYYTGYVNLNNSRYDWYFEFADRKIRKKQADYFAGIVDKNLMKTNIEYESKRKSFRLNAPAVFLLEHESFDKFKAKVLRKTHSDHSRFKPNVLSQNEEYHDVFKKLSVGSKKED